MMPKVRPLCMATLMIFFMLLLVRTAMWISIYILYKLSLTLAPVEEEDLVTHIIALLKVGFLFTLKEICEIAYNFVKANNIHSFSELSQAGGKPRQCNVIKEHLEMRLKMTKLIVVY